MFWIMCSGRSVRQGSREWIWTKPLPGTSWPPGPQSASAIAASARRTARRPVLVAGPGLVGAEAGAGGPKRSLDYSSGRRQGLVDDLAHGGRRLLTSRALQ